MKKRRAGTKKSTVAVDSVPNDKIYYKDEREYIRRDIRFDKKILDKEVTTM